MKTERTIWVAYKQDSGFITRTGGTTDNFNKARVYNQKNHLSTSVGSSRLVSGEIIAVPILMEMDPEVMLILKLGGQPIIEKG